MAAWAQSVQVSLSPLCAILPTTPLETPQAPSYDARPSSRLLAYECHASTCISFAGSAGDGRTRGHRDRALRRGSTNGDGAGHTAIAGQEAGGGHGEAGLGDGAGFAAGIVVGVSRVFAGRRLRARGAVPRCAGDRAVPGQ